MDDSKKEAAKNYFMEFDEWFKQAGKEKGFDRSFIDSINEAFDKYGKLTDKQFASLERIIGAWCRRDN